MITSMDRRWSKYPTGRQIRLVHATICVQFFFFKKDIRCFDLFLLVCGSCSEKQKNNNNNKIKWL